jgi:hypothetical protein
MAASVGFVDISFDIDAYLASGGQLMKLNFTPCAYDLVRIKELTQQAAGAVDLQALRERIMRCVKFCDLLGKQLGDDETIGSVLTEKELRVIWGRTKRSHATEESAHVGNYH